MDSITKSSRCSMDNSKEGTQRWEDWWSGARRKARGVDEQRQEGMQVGWIDRGKESGRQ